MGVVKLKFHDSSFPCSILVTSSKDVCNKSGVSATILARMSRGCYAENGPVEFKLMSFTQSLSGTTISAGSVASRTYEYSYLLNNLVRGCPAVCV